ncbi:MAG: hypothetical protein U0528_11495 [Anaerolineae bacterium]
MQRKHNNVEPIYPFTAWDVIEREFRAENNYRNETIFALGNGTIGMQRHAKRASTVPLRAPISMGSEREVIRYPEPAPVYAEHSQTLLNVTNAKIIQFYVEDELFPEMQYKARIWRCERSSETGILERLRWRSAAGREVQIDIERLVSCPSPCRAIRYSVMPLNFDGSIRFNARLDGDVRAFPP